VFPISIACVHVDGHVHVLSMHATTSYLGIAGLHLQRGGKCIKQSINSLSLKERCSSKHPSKYFVEQSLMDNIEFELQNCVDRSSIDQLKGFSMEYFDPANVGSLTAFPLSPSTHPPPSDGRTFKSRVLEHPTSRASQPSRSGGRGSRTE
jgi:hypothetical protein